MRIQVLDGFRGSFLLFMAIVHANDVLDVTLGKLNHHYFGWVEDAQGFVFISGFVVGLVYGGLLLRGSFEDMRAAVLRRAGTIYAHQAGLILIFLAAAFALGALGRHPAILQPYQAEPAAFTAASLSLIAGSMHMGILPMYILFMLVTPFALRMLDRGRDAPFLLLVALSWVFAQTGLLDAIEAGAEAWLAAQGTSVRLGIFFNVFGWQALFFGGLWLGFRQAQGRLDLSFLRAPQHQRAFFVGLAAFVLLGLFDRAVFDHWISPEFSRALLAGTSRQDFSALYPAAFLLDLFLIAWLFVAGPSCGVRAIERLAALAGWIMTRPFLVFLGRHSLHVFSFHILAVYALAVVLEGREVSEAAGSALLIGIALSLYVAAWGHLQLQKRGRAARSEGTAARAA